MDKIVFFSIIWTLFMVAVSTAVARIITHSMPYHYENIASISSVFLLLASCIINTVLAQRYYNSGTDRDSDGSSVFSRLQFCSNILYLSCLWLVKLGIHSSYYSIVHTFRYLKLAWFSILGMVIMAYVCCVISYPFTHCTDSGKYGPNPIAKDAHEDSACGPAQIRTSSTALWLVTSWDVVTNVALIAFLIVILTSARLSHRVRTLAAVRFAVISLIIWISVVRSASSYSVEGLGRAFWLHLWGSIQNSTFIIISNSLAIRSQLLSRSSTRRSLVTSYVGSMHSAPRPISEAHDDFPPVAELDELQGARGMRESEPFSAFSWFSDTSQSERTCPSDPR